MDFVVRRRLLVCLTIASNNYTHKYLRKNACEFNGCKNDKSQMKNCNIFPPDFCSKHRLWVPTRLAVCSHCILSICNFIFSRFGFEGGVWVFIAPAPVIAYLFFFTHLSITSSPKGSDRSPYGQQVNSSNYFYRLKVKR